VDLPPDLEGPDIEVVVQIRQGGKLIAQGQQERSAPGTGAVSRLTLELKRG
jgi:hypothetical protein